MDHFATHEKKTRDTHLWEWISLFGDFFALSILRVFTTCFRYLEYDSGQERRPRPTRPNDISQQEILKFSTFKQCADWSRSSKERISRTDHRLALSEETRNGKKIWDDSNKAKLKGLVKDPEASESHLILYAKKKGSWLNIQGTTVTGILFTATGYCDFMRTL